MKARVVYYDAQAADAARRLNVDAAKFNCGHRTVRHVEPHSNVDIWGPIYVSSIYDVGHYVQ
jgi:hypothetical protein